jgi:hypothetical protein
VTVEVGGLQPREAIYIQITVKVLQGVEAGEKIWNSARLKYEIGGSERGKNSNWVYVIVGGVTATPPVGGIIATPTPVGGIVDTPTPMPGGQTPGDSDQSPVGIGDGYIHYMVKYVCGVQTEVDSGEPPVKPANYATAINIQNYLDSEQVLSFRPALHYLLGEEAPPIFGRQEVSVAPLSGLSLDCNSLWEYMEIDPGTFIEGMVDIRASITLPVAAVYTAEITDHMEELTDTGAGISIDVEYIQPFYMVTP